MLLSGATGHLPIEMGHEEFERCIVRIWQFVDLLMQPYMPQPVVLISLYASVSLQLSAVVQLTRSFYELMIQPISQERFWQLSEPQFQRARDNIDIRGPLVRHYIRVLKISIKGTLQRLNPG
jgi:hypothetical protein